MANAASAFRVGIFLFLTLLFLSAGVFLIGDKEFLFSPTYTLETTFPNVSGLINGAEVRVAGVREGSVKRIELPSAPGGKVTVVMKLHARTRNIIRKDSIAAIKTEGLLGNKYIEISVGTEKAEAANDGEKIASAPPEDMAAQAKSLAAEAKTGVQAFRDDMEALQHSFFLRGFFNKRGYNDPKELTKDAIRKPPSTEPDKVFTYDPAKMFAKPDNAQLKDKKALDEVGKFLEANKFRLVVVSCSAVVGDTDKDKVLTKARAKVIRDYLAQNFKLDDKRIKTLGLGKSKEPGDTGKVQILVYLEKPAEP
jgi:outer membrane protein OmpA-like peptidoglycan-associated protein